MPAPPQITTARLLLRRPEREDFDAYAALTGDEMTARYIGGVQSRPLAWRSFMAIAGAWDIQGFSMFSVVLRDTGEWIGRVGPWMPEGWPGTEVGWGIRRDCWNRGYATEAAQASIDWAFEVLGWDDVIHTINPDNRPSIAVAEKLGSRHRGPSRLPEPLTEMPVEIWGQTREEWLARREAGT